MELNIACRARRQGPDDRTGLQAAFPVRPVDRHAFDRIPSGRGTDLAATACLGSWPGTGPWERRQDSLSSMTVVRPRATVKDWQAPVAHTRREPFGS